MKIVNFLSIGVAFADVKSRRKRNYVKIECEKLENELFLRNFDYSWQEILKSDNFCQTLYNFSIYRYSFTLEELNKHLCPLLENVKTKLEYEIVKLWRRKAGYLGNKCNY